MTNNSTIVVQNPHRRIIEFLRNRVELVKSDNTDLIRKCQLASIANDLLRQESDRLTEKVSTLREKNYKLTQDLKVRTMGFIIATGVALISLLLHLV